MDANFWHDKWASNRIAFHKTEANPVLIEHLPKLDLEQNARIFVPLCGKSLDIAWLLAQGYRVVGIELSELAIQQLFAEMEVEPNISEQDGFKHFTAPNLDIFVGDFFDLSQEKLGKVEAIYDRAALVALPDESRKKYSQHLRTITQDAPQLLVTFVYDQNLTSGPPFSVDKDELLGHYASHYNISHLATVPIPNGHKGQFPAEDQIWILR